jgi:hypothetical protein
MVPCTGPGEKGGWRDGRVDEESRYHTLIKGYSEALAIRGLVWTPNPAPGRAIVRPGARAWGLP